MTEEKTSPLSERDARAREARVWQLFGTKQAKPALAACEELNRLYPNYGSGWHSASQLLMRVGNPTSALVAIERALSIDKTSPPWLLQQGMCLARLGRLEELGKIIADIPLESMDNAHRCSALGLLHTHLGDRDQALLLYLRAAEFEPDDARHRYNIACMQRSLGQLDAAEVSFDAAIARDPDDFESIKIRSDLRMQTAQNNHVSELEKRIESGTSDPRGEVQLRYAVAKELEDLREYARSFDHLKSGSDLRRSLMKYDVQRDLETIAAIRAEFSAEVLHSATDGCESAEPIFILGMPRSGTTLVERILATHTDVFAAGELNNLAAQLMVGLQSAHPGKQLSRRELVARSAQLDFASLGRAYVDSTRPATAVSPRFIDKMPLNYLYIGIIHRALPNAKIINVRRDPMDTCYAMYKQLFVDAYPFSYDLDELARYYAAYSDLMDHWNAVLPNAIHTIDYEQLVEDTESGARALLEFCALDWQDECLKFYENRSASTTASAAQIRQPVYSSSVGKWRNYEQQLQPLVEALHKAGVRHGSEADASGEAAS